LERAGNEESQETRNLPKIVWTGETQEVLHVLSFEDTSELTAVATDSKCDADETTPKESRNGPSKEALEESAVPLSDQHSVESTVELSEKHCSELGVQETTTDLHEMLGEPSGQSPVVPDSPLIDNSVPSVEGNIAGEIGDDVVDGEANSSELTTVASDHRHASTNEPAAETVLDESKEVCDEFQSPIERTAESTANHTDENFICASSNAAADAPLSPEGGSDSNRPEADKENPDDAGVVSSGLPVLEDSQRPPAFPSAEANPVKGIPSESAPKEQTNGTISDRTGSPSPDLDGHPGEGLAESFSVSGSSAPGPSVESSPRPDTASSPNGTLTHPDRSPVVVSEFNSLQYAESPRDASPLHFFPLEAPAGPVVLRAQGIALIPRSDAAVSQFELDLPDPVAELIDRFPPVLHCSKLAEEAMKCPPSDPSAPILPLPTLDGLALEILSDDD
jgi:hypothetical protein